jgi:membrane protease YdiL (CAAX protease family)
MPLPAWAAALHLDGAAVAYAAFVGLVMPWMAVRSTRHVARIAAGDRGLLYRRVLLSQTSLLVLAVLVAATHGVDLVASPTTGLLPSLGWSLLGFAIIVAALRVSWHTRSVENKRSMWVRLFLPSTGQRGSWIVLALVAGAAEEATYRGLLFAILVAVSGNFVFATLASALVFGLAHHAQGPRSQLTIGVVALVLQGVVLVTGSLVCAAIVHAAANIFAGLVGPARFRAIDESVAV